MQDKLGLYLQTARYYRASQILARLRMSAKSKLNTQFPWLLRRRYYRTIGSEINTQFRCFDVSAEGQLPDLETFVRRASQIRLGKFTFLNLETDLGSPIDWNPAISTRLWKYNLHYFDFAVDLARLASHETRYLWASELVGQIFEEWINGNAVGCGVGWHSYPTARRIVNWIQAYGLVGSTRIFRSEDAAAAWRSSLFNQALYLEDHLEYDCLGNHLLANGKALVFAGLFFSGKTPERWLQRGEEILWRGLEEQIHEDGGHEERSPMYQTIVLQDYLETVAVLRLNGRSIPAQVRRVLIKMADFLSGVRHPDGGIALFADSAFSIARDPDDVLAATARLLDVSGRWGSARPGLYCALMAPRAVSMEESPGDLLPILTSWPSTGYFKLHGPKREDLLIVDARPMGPPHLPAHGHCSLFNYELSIDGKRIIVDSGVEEYQPGPWRTFWRSSRAHNTLTVDRAEQTEIWAAFRAARRIQLKECSFAENDCGAVFVGRHSGFATQRRRTAHRRIIAGLREGIWLVLDQVSGEGDHQLDSYIHLHPEAWCTISESDVEFGRDSTRLRLYQLNGAFAAPIRISSIRGALDPIQGWYAPEFGKREPNSVLHISSNTQLPTQMGYLIAPGDCIVDSWQLAVQEEHGRAAAIRISINFTDRAIEREFQIPDLLYNSVSLN